MKIVYFHGFGSSGASGTVEILRRILPNDEIIAPDIPIEPLEALPYLKEYCEEQQPDLIIGTSMGGMYAHQMKGFKRMSTGVGLKTGVHKFFNRRKDNQKEFKVTRELIQHHNQIERQQFKDITDDDREKCYGLFGINDPVVKTYDLFHKYYPNAQRFEGEHRLNEKVLRKVVLPLIEKLRP